MPINEKDQRAQLRIEGKDYLQAGSIYLVGGEIQNYSISKDFTDTLRQNYKETQLAGYTELEWTPINLIAIRPGLRYEHSALLNKDNIAPRISMAIKTSASSQISLASGIFYENPEDLYLLAGLRPEQQEAIHYIANWQYTKNDRTLRIEGYYKKYEHLVVEHDTGSFDPNTYRIITQSTQIDNSGYGYAQAWNYSIGIKKL